MERKRSQPVYDRAKEIKAFDETKAGVKGLVDAGIEKIPQFFVLEESIDCSQTSPTRPLHFEIPVIDIGGVNGDLVRHKQIIEEIRNASETWGFFQVVNHAVSKDVMDEMVEGVRRFNEQAHELKMEYYSRENKKKVKYLSNYNLYTTKTANWRDTLFISMFPDAPEPEEFPITCREIAIKYAAQVQSLAHTLFELLAEALGLEANHLNEMECGKGLNILCNYYPACPEPDRTMGIIPHKDPCFITILLQDDIGGLQVFHQDQWVHVPPVPGAFVVNIGDLLQLISNDKFKSVAHRVLANKIGPRISIGSFFPLDFRIFDQLYGPIKELLSDENPPFFRDILLKEYSSVANNSNTAALDHFRL